MATRIDPAVLHKELLGRWAERLEKYLPSSGDLRNWDISTIEVALVEDMAQTARDVIEMRIRADPVREPEQKPRCPSCGHALMGLRPEATHRHTLFGPIRFERLYGYCPACSRAFSPSGHSVEIRAGLL
jgi:uncharacterized protein with PIN domain